MVTPDEQDYQDILAVTRECAYGITKCYNRPWVIRWLRKLCGRKP